MGPAALALLGGAAALALGEVEHMAGSTESQDLHARAQLAESQIPIEGLLDRQGNRQVMWNYEDMQYFTHINVGDQELTGIVDTGSFELVVFESHCAGCGLAARYDKKASPTGSEGPMEQRLYYGSGDVTVRQAFDLVSIGSFSAINQTFWQADEAHMPVLQNAKFQSIIGVGPPETPANDFWAKTADDVAKLRRSLAEGVIPRPSTTKKVMDHLTGAVEMSRHKMMLSQYNVGTFSLCLGKQPGSSGYFIWNDTSPHDNPSLFNRVKVIGRHTWTLNMTDVHLSIGGRDMAPLGCENGCGAVIDSGTSLLMMPSNVVDLLEETITELGADCRNMQTLPEFTFSLDGHRFSLPPDAYLAELEESHAFREGDGHARIRNLKLGARCQLTVMESYSDTHWGPLWIIGMPFFRKYYTSFHVGRTHAERSLHIAPATAGCNPASAAVALALDRGSKEFTHRRFNLSRMYLPPLVRQAATSRFVHL